MRKLIEKIKEIKKSYFTFVDILKISESDEKSLKVMLNRMLKKGELTRISRGVYTLDISQVDWEELACEIYGPSYLSFEWVLSKAGVLSQQPLHLTVATARRSKTLETNYKNIIYRHVQPKMFNGYLKQGHTLVASKEKAFLDLAYLSLNGYAKFDVTEMNLEILDKKAIKHYLSEFSNRKLEDLIVISLQVSKED